MTALHKLAGMGRIHFEVRRGTQLDAINYCKKGKQTHAEWQLDNINGKNFGKNADFTEYGTPSSVKQGQRVDIEEVYQLAKAGKSDQQIIEEVGFAPYVRCYRALNQVRLQIRPEWALGREIILIHGDSGIGKTGWSYKNYPDLFEMAVQNGTLWFDGYAGEETVLIDDFVGEIYLSAILKILDIYLRKLAIKGKKIFSSFYLDIEPETFKTWVVLIAHDNR